MMENFQQISNGIGSLNGTVFNGDPAGDTIASMAQAQTISAGRWTKSMSETYATDKFC